ncbi:hypothetical protein ACI2OX_10540 [Bacillus sp. N9]
MSVNEKVKEYANVFRSAKVIDLQHYLQETFGQTIDQLRRFTMAAISISCLSRFSLLRCL